MIRRPPRSTPFPTRRSSDLQHDHDLAFEVLALEVVPLVLGCGDAVSRVQVDRKSTRLNSSHGYISYAVFCLKKKKKIKKKIINKKEDHKNKIHDKRRHGVDI